MLKIDFLWHTIFTKSDYKKNPYRVHQINFLLQNINDGDKMKAWKHLTHHRMTKIAFFLFGDVENSHFDAIGLERPIKTQFHSTFFADFKLTILSAKFEISTKSWVKSRSLLSSPSQLHLNGNFQRPQTG